MAAEPACLSLLLSGKIATYSLPFEFICTVDLESDSYRTGYEFGVIQYLRWESNEMTIGQLTLYSWHLNLFPGGSVLL